MSDQKEKMLHQVEQYRQQVTARLFDLGRGDIVRTQEFFLSFWTPDGPILQVWGDANEQDYLPHEGEIFDLSYALFVLHKLKYEVLRENWPAAMEHSAELGRCLPGAAEGIFFDKTQQHRHGGRNSRGLEAEERQEMYAACQEEINRLCLKEGHSFLNACKISARNIRKIFPLYPKETIHHDTIRKKMTKPLLES